MAEQQALRIGPWPRGIDRSTSELQQPEGTLRVAENVIFDDAGGARTRWGYDAVGGISETLSNLHEWIADGYYNYVSHDMGTPGNIFIMRDVVANHNPPTIDTVTGSYLSASQDVDFVQLNSDDLYRVVDLHQPRRLNWNGAGSAVTVSTLTVATMSVANKDAGTPADQFPYAVHGLTKHNRVFVANVTYGGVVYTSRIHFSDLLLPEKWYGLDYIDVDPESGGEITALVEYGDAILIFKSESIYMLSGSSPETFAITKLTSAYGTSVKAAVCSVDADVFFWDTSERIIRFNGQQFVDIGARLNYTHESSERVSQVNSIAHAAGKLYVSCYYYNGALPGTNSTVVYDLRHDRWEHYTRDIADIQFEPYRQELYMVGLGADGFYIADPSGTGLDWDDDGSAINVEIVTGAVAPGGIGEQYRVTRVDAACAAIISGAYGDVDVTMRRDLDSSKEDTVRIDDFAATNRFVRLGGFGGNRCTTAEFVIESVAGGRISIDHLELRLLPGSRHRGVEV